MTSSDLLVLRIGGASRLLILFSALLVTLISCSGRTTRERDLPGYPVGFVERGTASWYCPGFHGNRTASGEIYDMHQFTAAHRTLPLGSIVLVTSLTSGRQVTVRINDRGPFGGDRILDLSLAGAQALSVTRRGTDEIQLEVIRYIGKGSGKSLLRLQVASFADLTNAQAIVDRLKPAYSDVRIITVNSSGGPRYRVQAGRYHTLTQAEAAGEQLRRWTGTAPLIIRDDN